MASTLTDIQHITVSLSEPDLVLEPGSVAQLVVTMTNRQETADRLLLEVQGIDVEWYMIPVPAVNVAPRAQVSERILFKVAANSENRAGSYPFLVRVQAMETGEVGVAQATLTLKPHHALQVDLNPKRAVATFLRPLNEFEVAISNQGNGDETLDLYASDPDDDCAYEFDMERVTVKPGQTEMVPLVIRPKVSSVLGGMRLYGFTVSVRAVNDSYITANTHGQIEKRALISPLLGIFLLLLGFGVAGYFILRPPPPQPARIQRFIASYGSSDATSIPLPHGQSITLTWRVWPPKSKVVIYQRQPSDDGKQPGIDEVACQPQTLEEGSVVVTPKPRRTIYTLVVTSPTSPKQAKMSLLVTMQSPPAPPKPTLKSFTVDQPLIHQGDTVTLVWDGRAKQFVLDPGNVALSDFARTYQISPDRDTTYILRGLGENGEATPPKSLKVTVVPKNVCIAEISSFVAVNPDVYVGDRVRLKWKTSRARSLRLDTDKGQSFGEISAETTTMNIPLSELTVFTLTATDSAGNTVQKTVTVDPKPRPPAQEAQPSLPGDAPNAAPGSNPDR